MRLKCFVVFGVRQGKVFALLRPELQEWSICMKDTKMADFLAGVGLLILGIIVFVMGRNLPSAQYGLGSNGYPMFVGILLAIMGLIQAVTTLIKGGISWKISMPKEKRGLLLLLAVAVWSFLYVYLMASLGFLLTTPFYLFGNMMLFAYRKYVRAVIVSVGMSVGIFYLFTRVFFIFLPTGSLF